MPAGKYSPAAEPILGCCNPQLQVVGGPDAHEHMTIQGDLTVPDGISCAWTGYVSDLEVTTQRVDFISLHLVLPHWQLACRRQKKLAAISL